MRINERALASYSVSSATPVDRAGWLWKRGEVNREMSSPNEVATAQLKFYVDSIRVDQQGWRLKLGLPDGLSCFYSAAVMAVFTRRLGWVDNAETVNNAHAMALTIKKLGDQHNLLCRTVRVVLENLYLHLAEIGSLLSRSFQRRWFVLRGNLLFYFEKKSEGRGGDPAGVIVLGTIHM